MESTVTGPCFINTFGGTLTLPEHGNRPTDSGWIPYAGPQRVLASAPADSLVSTDSYRATPPIDGWTGAPDITWTTGGDVPWQATIGSSSVRSGLVWPGEVSWIEATVNGPGLLAWAASFSSQTLLFDITCDGILIPVSSGRLHLKPGVHHVRWQVANPVSGARTSIGNASLTRASFLPQPDLSFSNAISNGTLNFVEGVSGSFWQLVDDPALPGKALSGNSASSSFLLVLTSFGTITSQLKMEGTPLPGAPTPTALPAIPETAAPFPWLPWNSTSFNLPRRSGYQTFAAQVNFTTNPTVTVAEALDQPGLTWTADSQPPGLWQPQLIPGATTGDTDALYLSGAAMGDLAWLETTVTGPVSVTTDFVRPSNTEIGYRFFIDGALATPESQFLTTVRVLPGSHRLRWEVRPNSPLPQGRYAFIRNIATAALSLPDVNTLLDAPSLEWSAPGMTLSALTTGTHDGVDALKLGNSGVFTAALTGPGLVAFWAKGFQTNSLSMDSLVVPVPVVASSAWQQLSLPIPHGRHFVSVTANSQAVMDEFSFLTSPIISAETALDAPAGTSFSSPDPDKIGASSYPGFAEDGTDALLLMPGFERRVSLSIPPLSSVSMRVRAAFGTGTFAFQDQTSSSTSTTWTTRSFSTRSEGGMTTIYLRASLVPVMIDKLTVTTPPLTDEYFPWASAAGLSLAQQDNVADPDGDGLSNFTEFTFGLDPTTSDASRTGTNTGPGLPEISTFTNGDGLIYLEVSYWRRNKFIAIVETAVDPTGFSALGQPTGWTAAASPGTFSSPGPAGWTRFVWRSPTPVTPGSRLLARVRAIMP